MGRAICNAKIGAYDDAARAAIAVLSSDVAVGPREPDRIASPTGDDSALSEAARYLADSSERYCKSYEQQGHLHIQTGRAWDAMRRGREVVRAALAALPSEAIGRGWHDISTAPKDGTVVLIFCQYSSGLPEIKIGHWTPPVGRAGQYGHFVWQTEDKGQSFAEQIVTRWMPLPAGPVVSRPTSLSPDPRADRGSATP